MDHFENVVRLLLEKEGYWIVSSFKVALTTEEKRRTGKHSIPRPEIDLVAYKPSSREVLAIECKSFLDSSGVDPVDLEKVHEAAEGKYKLFTTPLLQSIVLERMSKDLVERGYLNEEIPIRLGLVVGKIKKGREKQLSDLCEEKSWFYWSPEDIRSRIEALVADSYENEALYIVAKLLLRK